MISIARTFGAPDNVPAGNAARHDVQRGAVRIDDPLHCRLEVHDVAVPAHLHELDHLDGARLADPAEIVAAQVDQHHVFGPLLRIGDQLCLQGGVLRGVCPARFGAGNRMSDRDPVLDRDQSLRARADDVEAVQPQQVHVRAGIGQPEHPVDVQRIGGRVDLEPLADHDLERFAGPDLLDRGPYGVLELARGPLPADRERLSKARSDHVDGVGSASCLVIVSIRSTASSYASSTRSSVASKLIALATSRPRCRGDRAQRVEASRNASSGMSMSRGCHPSFSTRRTAS